LLERDVIDPPIMFGAGGMLDASELPVGTGFGVIPHPRSTSPAA
jgi:hypothetical protein